jgi:hypothetical protein
LTVGPRLFRREEISNVHAAPLLDSTEFERLLDRLAYDIVDAAIYRRLHADLYASLNDYWREFSQSGTFWSLSFQAYAEVTLSRLSRIYVGYDGALSLGSWLKAIKSNPKLFPTPPDTARLDKDILSVTKDAVVKKFAKLRHNLVVHINWQNVVKNLRLGDRFALSCNEIDLLISRASEILDRYSYLFKRTMYLPSIVGHDDFQNTLEAVRDYIDRWDAKIAEDMRRVEEIERARAMPDAGDRPEPRG